MVNKKRSSVLTVFLAIAFLLLLAAELGRNMLLRIQPHGEWIYMIATRAMGGTVGLLLMCRLSYHASLCPSVKRSLRGLLYAIPCFLVVINNFPWLAFLSDDSYMTESWQGVLLYALMCFCVAYYEEMLFRGCIFLMFLEKRRYGTWHIFLALILSSAVFAVVHLVNLFMGAGLGATVLQIGYSFLIGGMCSVVLIKSGNIYLCVLLHAVYNFGGGFIPSVCHGDLWDTPTVIFTALLGTLTAIYVVASVFRIRNEETDLLFSKSQKSNFVKETQC